MNEIFARLWQNLYARVTGPMNLRLIIQPAVATILAIRAGLRTHIKIERLSSGRFSGTRRIAANCCDRDGRTWERFSSSPRFSMWSINSSFTAESTAWNC